MIATNRPRGMRGEEGGVAAGFPSGPGGRPSTRQGLGGGYKFLVFVSGVIIPVFAVTGFLMWWLKRRNRRAGERAKAAVRSLPRGRLSSGDGAYRLPSAASAAPTHQAKRSA